jgi:hypothetical protein
MGLDLQGGYVISLASGILRLWSRTLRYRQTGYGPIRELRQRQRCVFTLWHDEMFAPCYLHRDEGLIAVVSPSGDGDLAAGILARMGYNLSRGSSSKGGMRALRQALALIRSLDRDVVLTVDGPRGPRHLVKEGAIYIAYKAGTPLVPVRVRLSRAKRFHKAWDRFQLPLPGSRCEIVYGEPSFLEGGRLDAARLESERKGLQARMEGLL